MGLLFLDCAWEELQPRSRTWLSQTRSLYLLEHSCSKLSVPRGCWQFQADGTPVNISHFVTLIISYEATSPFTSPERALTQRYTCRSQVALFAGRHYQYAVPGATHAEEDGFFTLVQYTQEQPQGRATALLNHKRGLVEVLRATLFLK